MLVLALRTWLLSLFAFAALIEVLIIPSYMIGGMPLVRMIQSQVFVVAVGGFYLWRMCTLSGRVPDKFFQKHGIDFDEMLREKRMNSNDGVSLCYSDKEWFVAVETGAVCVVYAPLVDFTRPIKPYMSGGTRGRGLSFTCLAFRYFTKDGTHVNIRVLRRSNQFWDWVSWHGGKMSG